MNEETKMDGERSMLDFVYNNNNINIIYNNNNKK